MASPNNFKEKLLVGRFDFLNDTIRVALVNNQTSYSFDPNNHTNLDDVLDGGTTAEEFGNSGATGYSRQTLQNVTVSQDDTDDEGVADADDLTFSSLDNATIQAVIVYKQVGGDDSSPSNDPIIAVYDDNTAGSLADLPLTTNGGDVTLNFNSEGIINIG